MNDVSWLNAKNLQYASASGGLSSESIAPCGLEEISSAVMDLIVTYRLQLHRKGWVHVPSHVVRRCVPDLNMLPIIGALHSASIDPKDPDQLRGRLMTRAARDSESKCLFLAAPEFRNGRPYVTYYQDATVNSDAGGKLRCFASWPDDVLKGREIPRLVQFVSDLIPGDRLDRRHRWQEVNIHGVDLRSNGRCAAVSSPPHLHRDGEPWTAIIQCSRINTAPGSAVNYIAERHCCGRQPQDCDDADILDKVEMTEPLEMIIVDDARVSHYVSPVVGAHNQPGNRASLLIDFSTLHPARTT